MEIIKGASYSACREQAVGFLALLEIKLELVGFVKLDAAAMRESIPGARQVREQSQSESFPELYASRHKSFDAACCRLKREDRSAHGGVDIMAGTVSVGFEYRHGCQTVSDGVWWSRCGFQGFGDLVFQISRRLTTPFATRD
jgi:hypothetical protein